VHITLRDGDGASAMLETVRALDGAQLAPVTLALREPTLDDVFLELTGHVAEEPASDGEDAAPTGRRRGRRRAA
jgi:ABC-2 type transport system ATP-binding protein